MASPAFAYRHEDREALLALIAGWCESHAKHGSIGGFVNDYLIIDDTAHTPEFWWGIFYDRLPDRSWTSKDIRTILRAPFQNHGVKVGLPSKFRVCKVPVGLYAVGRVFHPDRPPTRFNREDVI